MTKKIMVVANPQRVPDQLAPEVGSGTDWELFHVNTHEAAIELAHQLNFDLVVVDDSDPEIDMKKLKAVLPILSEEVDLLGYDGENPGAVSGRIKAVFDQKRLNRIRRFMVLDASMEADWSTMPLFSAN